MERLKLHSPDQVEVNIDKLAQILPGCVTETFDETTRKVTRSIDFDRLRQELSGRVVEGPRERYQLDWPGKREAIVASNARIAKTLRPCLNESESFDSTRNLFIEGDNLDALKLLQESFLGKVKLIYIDPPYNTGRDFIYNDDFAQDANEYFVRSQMTNSIGERLVDNRESNGRFHSDWLSMMYARIRLAINLLSEDGIFIASIDDGEVSNLRKICDELFGEQQFGAQIIWKKRNTPPNDRVIGAQHDYLLLYVKNDLSGINLRPRTQEQIERYKNPDNHPKGPWVAGDLSGNVKGGRYTPALNYPITNPNTGEHFYPPNNGNWRFNREKIERLLAEDAIYFGKDGKQAPKLKRFLCDVKEGATWTTLWDFAPFNTSGSNEMQDIFGNSTVFENPKPVGLIEHILDLATTQDSLVLDFFAGSSTTAHAVMKKNAIDGGRRRFIMIQMPEPCAQESEAFNLGYKNICEISKDRLRRAGSLINQISPNVDTGFRVLKVDTSNLAEVYNVPSQLKQELLPLSTNSLKPDRSDEDLLYQVLVDWGVDLAVPISRREVNNRTVFFVDGNALVACFDNNIDELLVRELAYLRPLRVIFRDGGYTNDSMKINVEQIFKLLSPETEVRSL